MNSFFMKCLFCVLVGERGQWDPGRSQFSPRYGLLVPRVIRVQVFSFEQYSKLYQRRDYQGCILVDPMVVGRKW